ncbi:MAG: ATP-dependent helicase [Desulfobulbaceae bacterium]|nr:ATP-dependent helicase [Desulfobulbaceae bacterium]
MQQSLFGESIRNTPGVMPRKIDFSGLNSPQMEAVKTTDGPVLVIAGAGSGKTRTLVYRVAYLIEQGVQPERILLLTFTRKASQEMLHRASQLLDDSCNRVMGGTFHAVASLLLRRYGFHLGYSPQFSILDRSDSEGIVNLLKSSLEVKDSDRKFPSRKVIVNILSQMVNKRQTLHDVIDQRYAHFVDFIADIEQIGQHYAKFKLEHNLMDYDDLLVNLQRVLSIPEVGQEISSRYSYVMVDEYQDTNPVQAEIIRLISAPHSNVMVVGDDSQSIYSFRGADFRNIMEFPSLYSGVRLIRLEENYRSTQPILTMTNAIIEQAAEKYTKKLFTSVEGGQKPLVYSARNDSDQAAYVASTINSLIRGGTACEQIAVLFRSGFHSYKLELELANRQLPFEKRGGMKLTESAHIKDILSLLRVIYNPQDNLAWNRILLFIDKVGPKTAQTILAKIKTSDDPIGLLTVYPANKSWQEGLLALANTLQDIRAQSSPLAQYKVAIDYYQDILERLYHDDYPSRTRDLEQLQEIVAEYSSLDDFIHDTALDPPEAGIGSQADGGAGQVGRLILSTVHSSKGLEWEHVFVINLAEGKFPSAMALTSEEIEEERRLLYVASTRAKRNLYLVYPREIAQAGRMGEPAMISRFLEEIPPGLTMTANKRVESIPASSFSQRVVEQRQVIFSREDLTGSQVRHPFFGEGRVLKMAGPRTVQVFFARHGQKTINLDYVKMEIVGG